ncbi:OrNVorf44-like [Venturia canescens]|uniref:OrNVorf44-like n=2 Tax=Venturia canescens TaxID=32260 RepID=A0ACB9ZIF9_9HYME|nr:uncharacterized LOC122408207 [Venturia canescens]AJZ73116.1 hypothetical protein [Venturia canescens]KAI5630593.1 OrNVorf44-like [Venturia canescens]
MAREYFDESLFVDGSSVLNSDEVGVSNDADQFLVEKYGIPTSTVCSDKISINPPVPCGGINIYTMNKRNKETRQTYRFRQINVSDALESEPIEIAELKDSKIALDVNPNISSLECAIMTKYFAVHNDIVITHGLYRLIEPHFQDGRAWFLTEGLEDTIVQNSLGELIKNKEILNVPNVSYFGPAIDLY